MCETLLLPRPSINCSTQSRSSKRRRLCSKSAALENDAQVVSQSLVISTPTETTLESLKGERKEQYGSPARQNKSSQMGSKHLRLRVYTVRTLGLTSRVSQGNKCVVMIKKNTALINYSPGKIQETSKNRDFLNRAAYISLDNSLILFSVKAA